MSDMNEPGGGSNQQADDVLRRMLAMKPKPKEKPNSPQGSAAGQQAKKNESKT